MIDLSNFDVNNLPSVGIEDRLQMPKTSGIYFAVNENNEILYIGKAVSFYSRWAGHHRYTELRQMGTIRLHWMQFSEIEKLKEIEDLLIEHFSPPLNNSPVKDEAFKGRGRSLDTISLVYQLTLTPQEPLTPPMEIILKRIIGEVCKTYEWLLHSIEVMPDHVHLFVQADHTTAPVEIAKTIKSISAVQLFCTFPNLKRRKFWGSGMWSDGTYYSSVGHVSEDAVRKYIETQKQRG